MQIDKNVYEHLYVFANYFTYKFVLSSIYALSYKSSLQTETNQWKNPFLHRILCNAMASVSIIIAFHLSAMLSSPAWS